MRALVVSDAHFGAWTGRRPARHDWALQRLAPQLEAIDELVILGDLFDFLFATVTDAFAAADPFFTCSPKARAASGWSSSPATTTATSWPASSRT